MNIFIVSQLNRELTSEGLISQLSRIHCESRKTVSVVVVGERYNLSELPFSNLPVDYVQFGLDDFLLNDINHGVAPNKVAQCMDKVESNWILVDFGFHDQAIGADFVRNLSRYNYMNTRLRNRNLVFMVPSVFLCTFARVLNESFNNSPTDGIALVQSSQIRSLLMITHVERVLINLPLVTVTLRRIRNLFLRVYRRIARAA